MNYASPAFDINGNLVTVDLPAGDYSNLPAGYYTTPYQAAVARGHSPEDDPISAAEVMELYSDPSVGTQAAVNQTLSNPPPPSNYVAPTPPIAQGWSKPIVEPPPTPQQLIAQSYLDNGYTPPPAADLDRIASGEIRPPMTAPITPAIAADPGSVLTPVVNTAGSNNVAPPPANNQTTAQTIPTMTGVYDDTGAFTTGSDQAGRKIMQLVDSGGNLLQWIDGASSPVYVTAPPAVNEKRLIGQDADGNPVFQLIDAGRNLVQWTENRSQGEIIVAPKYITEGNATMITPSNITRSGGTVTPPPGTTTIPPGSVTSLERPVRIVGQTAAGWPIKQLVDAGGVTKQWIEQGGALIDLVNAPTYGVLFHTIATDAQTNNPGRTVVDGGTPPPPAGGGTDRSRAQIQVGTTTAGFAIYQLMDSGGTVKQWILDPRGPNGGTIIDLVDAPTYGVLYRDAVIDAALARTGGGTATGTAPKPVSMVKLIIAAVLVGVLFARTRRED